MGSKRGTNKKGNQWKRDDNGDWSYKNSDGSKFFKDKHHRHFINKSGNGGWHENERTGERSSGKYFRKTNKR